MSFFNDLGFFSFFFMWWKIFVVLILNLLFLIIWRSFLIVFVDYFLVKVFCVIVKIYVMWVFRNLILIGVLYSVRIKLERFVLFFLYIFKNNFVVLLVDGC